jgi:hypothetical protein
MTTARAQQNERRPQKPPAAPRRALGHLLLAIADWLDGRGLTEQVRARVSSETRAVLDKPPGHFEWMSSEPIDEIEKVIGELAGVEALETLGLETARNVGGGLAKPMLRAAFVLLGDTPASAFSNLGRFFGVATEGIAFRYLPLGETVGVVEARFAGDDTPSEALSVLRGTLRYVFEISGQEGEVDVGEIEEEGQAGMLVRYRVKWGRTSQVSG